jgi:tetratricopeptide (TPR) repeat protein
VTRGLSFYLTHAYEDALAFFRQANNDEYWRSNESRQVVYLFLGNAASRASFLDEAEEAYLGALEIAPEYARGYVGLGSIYYLQSLSEATSEDYDLDFELLDRATELFLKALEVEIQQPSADIPSKVAFGLGQIDLVKWWSGMDTLATAVKHFEQVITNYDQGANPRIQELASEAYARLGLVKRQLGDIDGALEQFMTAIELSTFPDRKGLYWATMADLYDQKGDDTKAEEGNHSSIQEYTVALSLTTMPEQLAAYYASIANRYEALGEIDNAKDALQRAINLLPEGSEDRSIYENRLDTIR